MKNIQLIIIDPQEDFCNSEYGSLYVKGSEIDMMNISNFIKKFKTDIKQIHISMDCHRTIDISHPKMWEDKNGNNPEPFTLINSNDIKEEKWIPIYKELKDIFINYCKKLEDNKRYHLFIWPEHCKIGTKGNNISPILLPSLEEWEFSNKQNINFIAKGSNPHTEHYSALKAEIPINDDNNTKLNKNFINSLKEADRIYVCGEAKSHCLRFTIEDLITEFKDKDLIKKIFLLENCTSPVLGFEQDAEDFIKDISKQGVNIIKTTDVK